MIPTLYFIVKAEQAGLTTHYTSDPPPSPLGKINKQKERQFGKSLNR